jgi:hypothetical protein
MDEIIQSIRDGLDLQGAGDAFLRLPLERRKKILGALEGIRNINVGQFLNMVYPLETEKEMRKLIRKCLFRLKAAGITVEEPKETGEPVLKRVAEEREHKGFMSNYDPEGTRLVIVAFQLKSNSFALFHAITHFSEGLVELVVAPVDRQGIEMLVGEYAQTTEESFTFARVSPKYASFLIEEAGARSRKFGEEVKQVRQFAAGIKTSVQKPVDIYALPAPDSVTALPVEKILADDVFTSFRLHWDTMDQDKKDYQDIGGSSIILPPYMIEEKRQAFLETLLAGADLKAKLPLIKRLLEDYAYLFHATGELRAYKGFTGKLSETNGPLDVLRYFVRTALEKTEEKQPGLIVSPYEQVRS